MEEQRKYALLFAATILAARKLNELGSKPCPARECAISDAISNAELVLRRIDERWPAETAAEVIFQVNFPAALCPFLILAVDSVILQKIVVQLIHSDFFKPLRIVAVTHAFPAGIKEVLRVRFLRAPARLADVLPFSVRIAYPEIITPRSRENRTCTAWTFWFFVHALAPFIKLRRWQFWGDNQQGTGFAATGLLSWV